MLPGSNTSDSSTSTGSNTFACCSAIRQVVSVVCVRTVETNFFFFPSGHDYDKKEDGTTRNRTQSSLWRKVFLTMFFSILYVKSRLLIHKVYYRIKKAAKRKKKEKYLLTSLLIHNHPSPFLHQPGRMRHGAALEMRGRVATHHPHGLPRGVGHRRKVHVPAHHKTKQKKRRRNKKK